MDDETPADIEEAPPAEPVETDPDGYATEEEDTAGGNDGALISGALMGGIMVANTVQAMIRGQTDPCQASRELQTWDTNIWRPNYIRAITRARNLSERLQLHIADSILTRGASGGTGIPLQDYLVRYFGGAPGGIQALMPPAAFAGCFALAPLGPLAVLGCQMTWIRNHLPTGIDVLNETIPQTMDQSWFSGVGYSGPAIGTSRVGRLCGPDIAAACQMWVIEQRQSSSPASNPRIRERLTNLVGTWQGNGPFEIWQAPTHPEAIFSKRRPKSGGIFESLQDMEAQDPTGTPTPSLGACAEVTADSWHYTPTGGGGDPILGGSKLYEIIKFRLFQADYRECMVARCYADSPTNPPNVPNIGDTTTNDDEGLEADYTLYIAAGLAAFLLARR